MHRLSRLSIIAIFVLASLAGAGRALAQQGPRTVVAVTAEFRGYGERLGPGPFLDVYADGKLCGRLAFTDPAARTADGGAEFELDRADQPAACSTEGATLSFRNGDGAPLVQTMTLKRGARLMLTNLGSVPGWAPAPLPTVNRRGV